MVGNRCLAPFHQLSTSAQCPGKAKSRYLSKHRDCAGFQARVSFPIFLYGVPAVIQALFSDSRGSFDTALKKGDEGGKRLMIARARFLCCISPHIHTRELHDFSLFFPSFVFSCLPSVSRFVVLLVSFHRTLLQP
jgi:hypothetical protein